MLSTGRVTAVLGPTNTGKTHHAIERMLTHRTGVMGLPLRLLAREVYDRVVAKIGPSTVALVTGEERIIPPRTQYWICTTEAMPQEIGADFVCVDEIQLCADPDRGHIFTDRLLHARGLVETLFLGADTMRGAISGLVHQHIYVKRDRFSTLSYAGSKKISRMPPRSAIVGFSVENVYAIAELIRRQKGGCAVVMGALSPRTRNAQVALYQNGEVDYLVATDAIGMGLNLDIKHVAFSSTRKFDGQRMRDLTPQEIAQIAGRAGRHTEDGTFGVTGEARPFDEDLVDAIESHRFSPVKKLMWRNSDLEFGSAERLIRSLEAPTSNDWLSRARDADDVLALKALSALPEVRDRLTDAKRVRLLWDVCRIPDFRNGSDSDHITLLTRIFEFLCGRGLGGGRIPTDWMAKAVERIDKTTGDIDVLSRRLAHIRTWTYVTQRKNWVDDESHWREETRAVEDRLSDALHAALTQRFVDRRTSLLLRRLKQKEDLVAEVSDKGENRGEVTVEGQFVGKLEGFRFQQDATGSADEAKTLRQAAMTALRPEFSLRADRFYNAPDTEMDFTEQGGLMWGNSAVGKLVKGSDPLKPAVEPFVDEEAGEEVVEKVRRRLQHFIDRKVAAQYEPLMALGRDETLQGLARGFAFRLTEALGVLPREDVAQEVKELDQESRASLRKHGVRFGQYTVFLPALLKPAPTRLRLVLWSLWNDLSEFPESPPPGLVTIPNIAEVPKRHYTLSGYHPAGVRAIRIDMLERLADILRQKDSRAGFEATPDMLSITGMTLDQFADLMGGLGYKGEKAERAKAKAAEAVVPQAVIEEAIEAAAAAGQPIPEGVSLLAPVPEEAPAPEAAAEGEAAEGEAAAPVEMETYYSFTWAPKPRFQRPERAPREGQPRRGRPQGEQAQGDKPQGERPQGDRPRGDRPRGDRPKGDRPQGDRPQGERPQGDRPQGERRDFGKGGKPAGKGGKRDFDKGGDRERKFEARPPRAEKPIDPDNPFAALLALKGKV
ncbi:helicase-related protein [Xinfangfangia sp. CPCC 101601]|uniref:Helicase-related protein n=1 Tax=Pseudogemmobacter lacusdianii TaxID=3069608 RepID=A0ABU0VVI8_9RHOB|nr:helicase-related protein [Xinfangfangia sp. CPCC 101601]MDQ2064980.1 helicase-related protein [Xinfangfangia sp. CPCC 101601]